MSSLLGQCRSHVSAAMLRQKESIIRLAVAKFLGSIDFELRELVERLKVYMLPAGVEQFQMDGTPIVEFYPIQFSQGYSEVDFQTKVNVCQEYKILV